MTPPRELTDVVKGLARAAGFSAVGVTVPPAALRMDAFRRWIERGLHGEMDYMAANAAKRLDPFQLLAGARSILSLAVGYAPPDGAAGSLVARYARGRDYHRVLKRRCHALIDRLRERFGTFEGRAFVDSAPLPERSLAAAAGVGWIGRNGCLIVPGLGSYVVLCEIVCNLELRPDAPIASQCADCGACAAACPTGAIVEPALPDTRRCLSYLTVEHRGPIAEECWPKMGCRLLGCDACQEACPHNRGAPAGDAELTAPLPGGAAGADLATVLAWEPSDWDAATRGSAARRATYAMFLRNAILAAGNSGRPELREPLHRLRTLLPAHDRLIAWALGRLDS